MVILILTVYSCFMFSLGFPGFVYIKLLFQFILPVSISVFGVARLATSCFIFIDVCPLCLAKGSTSLVIPDLSPLLFPPVSL